MSIFSTKVKTIVCPRDQWTKIIGSWCVALDKDWNVSFASDDGPVAGEVVEVKYVWIVPRDAVVHSLKPRMSFHRNMINGLYSVSVKPAVDVTATISA